MPKKKYFNNMADEQIKQQIIFMFEIEKRSLTEIKRILHLGDKRFIEIRNQIVLNNQCKCCGKEYIFDVSSRYCNDCAETNPYVLYHRKKNKEYQEQKKFKKVYAERTGINASAESDKIPKYHAIPKLEICDCVNVQTKRQKEKNSEDNFGEYHIPRGIVKEIYSHGILLEGNNNVREFIAFIDIKTGKYILTPQHQEKHATAQI